MDKRQRYIGLDVGDARVGIAISDPLGLTVKPLTTLKRSSGVLSEIIGLVVTQGVTAIVVGLPLTLSGDESEQTRKTREFTEKLERQFRNQKIQPIPIILWDERLSSKTAEQIIQGSTEKNRSRRELIDAVSATVILQSYVDAENNRGTD